MQPANWQSFEHAHLKRLFSHFNVDCVFDVGANRGQYRSVLRGPVGFKGPIISFEPLPFQVSHILNAKALEDDREWYIEDVALDNEVGEKEFNIMVNDQFSSLKTPSAEDIEIFKDINKIREVIKVKTRKLETYFEKYFDMLGFTAPFLKMDTQGNDLNVFIGAGSRIVEFVGLQSELSIRKIYAETMYYYQVIDYYTKNGFTLSALVPNNAGHFPDLVEIDCIMYRRRVA